MEQFLSIHQDSIAGTLTAFDRIIFKGQDEKKKCCARVSRLIAKLRGHGLLAKVKGCRLYRVTTRGYRLMSAALGFRFEGFPHAVQAA